MSDPEGNPLKIKLVDLAGICHEANRALQHALGEKKNLPWQTCGEEMRERTTEGVRRVLYGFDVEELHEAWTQDMLAEGWRYGTQRNETKRLHPSLVPYNELPDAQKAKDHLLKSIVLGLGPRTQVEE